MVDFTSGIDFTATDPFTLTLRAAERKLTNRVSGYPSKTLMEWCDQRGGLRLFTYRGDQPRVRRPEYAEMPAIVIVAADAPETENVYNATAARIVYFRLNFTGWLRTDDQEEAFAFWWKFLGAISKPYLKNDFDEFYGPNKVPDLESYWAGSPTFFPWGEREDRIEAYGWTLDVTFAYSLDLFV